MSNIILVTSGKGGVGKSTVASALGLTFAAKRHKTIIIELDVGLRGLDLMLGVEDRSVYDLGNILKGECRLSDAIIPVTDDGNLSLIVAPVKLSSRMDYDDIIDLCKILSTYFDTVIIDAPAGIGVSLLVAPKIPSTVLLVATPDHVSARDAGRLAGMLAQYGAKKVRLIINKVDTKKPSRNEIKDLDAVIDTATTQLIGVIPLCSELSSIGFDTDFAKQKSLGAKVLANIYTRLLGEYIELLIQ